MPRVSEFYGIVIRMYHDDHLPPHFHAEYAGATAASPWMAVRYTAGSTRGQGASSGSGRGSTASSSRTTGPVRALDWTLSRSTRSNKLRSMIKGLPRDYLPRVVAARVCGPFSVFVVFDDGVSKRVNLRRRLKGPVFRPFRTPEGFAKLRVDHEAGTIVWPNRADIAPETLYLLPDERGNAA